MNFISLIHRSSRIFYEGGTNRMMADAQIEGHRILLHRSGLPPGIYLLRIGAGSIFTGKVLVE